MIRGQPIPVLLPPVLRTDLDPAEAVAPDVIALSNGTLTLRGQWRKRPGFAPKWQTGARDAVTALVPALDGYAITAGGEIFHLLSPANIPLPTAASSLIPAIPPTPLAFWGLDEPSGTRNDAIGGQHLTQSGGVGFTTGKLGSAAAFTRTSSQYLTRTSEATLQTGNINFTVAVWVYRNDSSIEVLVQKWAAGQKEYTLNLQGAPVQFFVSANGAADAASIIGADIPTAVWTLVIAWHDATNKQLGIQVNDGPAQLQPYTAGITAGTAPFNIGHNSNVVVPPEQEFFDGAIDAVAFWKTVLTPEQRLGLWNAGKGLNLPASPTALAVPPASTTATAPIRDVRSVTGRLGGQERPTWAVDRDALIVTNGASPVAVSDETATVITAAPGNAALVATLNSYVLLAPVGSATRFRWSQAGNRTVWPVANFNDTLQKGGRIRMMTTLRHELYFFLDHHTEVWVNIGGDVVWGRRSVLDTGTRAGHSVVRANNTLYWLGDDIDIYRLADGQVQRIGQPIRRTLQALTSPQLVYGFDCRAEHVIRWIAPIEGLCIVYDYLHEQWWFDDLWLGGSARLPIASYMEIDGRAYVGDYNATGRIFSWSHEHRTDDGVPIHTTRRFRVPLSQDGTTARVNRLRLRVRRGDTPSATLLLRWMFDEQAWQPARVVALGPRGVHDPYVDFFALGLGRELQIELVHTDESDVLVTDMLVTTESLGR